MKRFLFQWVWLLFVVALPASALAAEEQPTILVVGDSLSAGYGLRPGESWVKLLEDRLAENERGYDVVNASISGDTSRGALARLPRALDVHDPDIVIIEIGGNDGLRGLPLAELRGNLEQMIAMSREAGADVLLLGIRLPANYGPDYTRDFRQLYSDLAEAEQVPMVHFVREEVALNPELMQDDGVHPNADAQPLMLDYVWPGLQPLLEQQGAGPAASADAG